MEVIFNNLSYIDDKTYSFDKTYFNNVSLNIKEGSIVSFVSTDLDILYKLFMVIKRPSKGEIIIGNNVIRRTSHIDDLDMLRSKIGFVSYTNPKIFLNDNIKDEIKEAMINHGYKKVQVKRIMDSLKMVRLSDKYLERNPDSLSFVEAKKLELACLLAYNPDIIILSDFEKGLTYKDREYFKKLFLKLKNDFKKTIILIGTDLDFLFNIVDNVYVMNKGNLVLSGNEEIFYNDKLYKYVDVPKIVEFTKFVNDCGYNINEYTDFKELIKELYRKVK